MKPVVAITFSNNKDNILPLLKKESQSIYNTLFSLHYAGAIELFRNDFLDLEGIIQIFNRFEDRIYIFHFGGHGQSDALFLGEGKIPIEKFAALLGTQKNKARLVFLNTFESRRMVDFLLDAGVMAVIASGKGLTDAMASDFAKYFYEALSRGETVRRSFDYARNIIAPPKEISGSEVTRGIKLGEGPSQREDIPLSLYVKEIEEDILNWKLPLPTTTIVQSKATLAMHFGKSEHLHKEHEWHKLNSILTSLHDNYDIEFYQELYVSLQDILNTFRRFDRQVILYHFHGLEEWPVLRHLRQESNSEVEWMKDQLSKVKVFILNYAKSINQVETILDLGANSIIYTGERLWENGNYLKFIAWFYEFLKDGETLQDAFKKAAQNIWIFTDFSDLPSVIEYDAEKVESFCEPSGKPKLGLYINPDYPEVLNWVLPKPFSRGIDFDIHKRNALPTGKNYLLVIGVDKYRGNITALNNAVRDAKKFRNVLFENYRFEEPNTYSLFNRRASLKNILKTFDDLLEMVTPEDNLVLYFSGHGIVHPLTNRGYWLPVNAKLDDRSTFLSNSDALDFMKSLKARHVFGIVDSCFSASLFAQRSLDQITKRQYSIPSRWLLTAGRLEPVSDGSLGSHSPFADCLFAGLSANKTSVLWVEELCLHLSKNLRFNAEKQLPRGEPLQNVGHQGGQFVFMGKETDMNDIWESETIHSEESI